MKAAEDPQRPARLVRVSDRAPGISRLRRGSGFSYRDARGRTLTDAADLRRIRSLAIPPAYTNVWICARADGHLQATGFDARGRKQYRYHPRWRQQRDAHKFDRLIDFASALPRIRARVARELARVDEPGLAREVVLAAIVRLLDTTLTRIGNDEYARENRSFGLTTLQNRHAEVQDDRLRLRFRGKSGVLHDVTVTDLRVARIVSRCLSLPGADLFQYADAGTTAVRAITASDVNDFLRETGGTDISAKDFRTWHASVKALDLACKELTRQDMPPPGRGRSARRGRVQRVLREVAAQLGNTVTVCRKSYVHPAVLGVLAASPPLAGGPRPMRRCSGLRRVELRFLAFLESSAGAPEGAAQPASKPRIDSSS
ncbi:MAG TPA: DNA topoisomerase IB [Burkholderiaceae bacterium]|nr:DNA topoisomerase IB [Burkholderiaceae bacterium]